MSAIRWVWYSLIVCCVIQTSRTRQNTDVLVLTVASDETDGFRRYLRSIQTYGFADKLEILGMGMPWRGGDMKHPGGGYKVNLLKDKLKEFKDDCEKIILFTDSYDVIFLATLDEIVERFKSTNARILFAAENYCWPDESLADLYPPVDRGQAYLNSGGIIGYAMDLYAILSSAPIDDGDDDQLFYTRAYLDTDLRQKHAIQLDHQSQLFQNLFGASDDIQWSFENDEAYLYNKAYNTRPLIVHGNGRSKLMLNSLGNYLARAWSPADGCRSCNDGKITLNSDNLPRILLAIFITHPTPFLEEFLEKIYQLDYPKAKLDIFMYNSAEFHEQHVQDWLEKYGELFSSLKTVVPADEKNLTAGQELAMDLCLRKQCAGLLYVDSLAHLDNPNTLKLLLEQNRGIVAPMLVRPEQSWSNFWGAIADNGYYARSLDYMDIISGKRRGLWNVPYIHHCYFINATIIDNPKTRPVYTKTNLDPEMAFASTNRQRDVFMFVNNLFEFGHLVNADDFNVKLTNPDMYELLNNKIDWEQRYLHENYSKNFDKDDLPIQPCPDVYWFPIVNTRFTKEFIEVMEAFGQWSDGSNEDVRLQGGYENVPTRDIHMNQVNFERQWLFFLKEYVRPLQELVFIGYFHDPPRSLMNFVVRYKPDEQPSLRPHHDSSTYTINIALNQRGVDYEGGGCRFLRYDCAVTDTKPGWMLMHPGRLTHYHEGLKVTNGTRYIMISFVDP